MWKHFYFRNVGSEFSLVITCISGFKALNIMFIAGVCILYVDVNTFVILHSNSKGHLHIACDTQFPSIHPVSSYK